MRKKHSKVDYLEAAGSSVENSVKIVKLLHNKLGKI